MGKKVERENYVKLETKSYYRGWLRSLADQDDNTIEDSFLIRSCWPALLAIVKAEGQCGRIADTSLKDICEAIRVPWEYMSALLGAAVLKGAISIDDGVITVANWTTYQSDPTSAIRKATYRAKHRPPTPPQKEEKETTTYTETDRGTRDIRSERGGTGWNGDNGTSGDSSGNVGGGGLWKPSVDLDTEAIRCCQHVRAIFDAAFPPADKTRAVLPQAWNEKVTKAVLSGGISPETVMALTPQDMKAARNAMSDGATFGWGWVERYLSDKSRASHTGQYVAQISPDVEERLLGPRPTKAGAN